VWRKKTVPPERKVLRCSFCNKWQDDVQRLIAGPKIFICEECVEVCNDIIADDKRFAKSAAGTRAARAEEPIPWPNAIQCALCHVAIPADEGIVITGNRGTLCTDCVEAVEVARPQPRVAANS
jgi:hypothetical protein